MNPLLLTPIVFVVAVIQDILWAKYTICAARHEAFKAATWAGLIPVAGAIAVLAYVDDRRMLAPYAMGSWVGTFFAVGHEKGKHAEAHV